MRSNGQQILVIISAVISASADTLFIGAHATLLKGETVWRPTGR